MKPAHHSDCLGAVGRLSDHHEAGFAFEQFAETFAKNGMRVSDGDANGRRMVILRDAPWRFL